MLKPLFFCFTVLVGLFSWSQYLQYAPDLNWSAERETHVGFANPNKFPVTATLTGYLSSGEVLGVHSFDIPGLGRRTFSTPALFSSTELAFLKLESTEELGAFVVYDTHSDLSTVPFSSTPGQKVFVPHIARDTTSFFTKTTIANISPEKLPLVSQPFVDSITPPSLTPTRRPEPTPLPFDPDHSAQSQFLYEDLYPELTSTLQWDIITASEPQGLIGVEHFGKVGVQQASLALSRSPYQEMIISHLTHDRDHFWTGLVLVNTKDGIVPVDIQSYDEEGYAFQHLYIEMQPFEKKTFLIGEGFDLGISDIASWLRVVPYEQAIIGYEIFGSPNHTFMAGLEPGMIPTNMVALPFTPNDENHWSGFGMINPTDEDICVQIGGLDDEGNIIFVYDCKKMVPYSKFITTLDDFFGDAAKKISWVRLNTERGSMSAFSLTGDRQRTQLSALQGISTYNRQGTIFSANFEHDSIDTLVDQGWKEVQFDDVWRWWWEGNISIESYYEAVNGVKHLQVHLAPENFLFDWGYVDMIGMVSPFIGIPADKEEIFLSFYLRLIDPEHTNTNSRYGIIWREEGSSTWNWNGLTGEYILDSIENKYAFIEPQQWNLEVHQMTRWLPFQIQLPSNLAGKRIQIGVWYDSPGQYLVEGDLTPYLWTDLIRITTDSVIPEFMQTEVYEGHGTFIFDLP